MRLDEPAPTFSQERTAIRRPPRIARRDSPRIAEERRQPIPVNLFVVGGSAMIRERSNLPPVNRRNLVHPPRAANFARPVQPQRRPDSDFSSMIITQFHPLS